MAISLLRKMDKSFNGAFPNFYIDDDEGIYAEYICDSSSDIQNLPTLYDSQNGFKPRPGCSALDCDSSRVYVLSPSRVWKIQGGA